MPTNSTFDQIKEILVERFGIEADRIQPEASLQEDLALDSMDALDLLLAVNETCNSRIPEDVLENIHTISQLVSMVDKHRPKQRIN